MRWRDDQLPSNFHRVKNPEADEYQGARYSLAFFCQANEDVLIESAQKKYLAITAKKYLKQRVLVRILKGNTNHRPIADRADCLYLLLDNYRFIFLG